ncbi:hypothetical protein SDC9_199895 [bioreactor metagenome]|uniref:Uncharacterized protein n=1 Tax=bioreactor metagenome TaxID=1076179 RepID=A0A645IPB1_9ZZZZ
MDSYPDLSFLRIIIYHPGKNLSFSLLRFGGTVRLEGTSETCSVHDPEFLFPGEYRDIEKGKYRPRFDPENTGGISGYLHRTNRWRGRRELFPEAHESDEIPGSARGTGILCAGV